MSELQEQFSKRVLDDLKKIAISHARKAEHISEIVRKAEESKR